MHSKVRYSGLVDEHLIHMTNATTKVITVLLMAILIQLSLNTYNMAGNIVYVAALPITSKPIEMTAENLAWQAWLMLPLEQKNQIKSRKVTPKSIFLLPLRGDCPPDHHKIDFKCIPITRNSNAMLIDPNVLGLIVGDTNSTFDYDYENEQEQEEIRPPLFTDVKETSDYQETTKSIRQDEPLKFNIFLNHFTSNYDEANDDYFSLSAEMQTESTDRSIRNVTIHEDALTIENSTEIFKSTLFENDTTTFKTTELHLSYETTPLFNTDIVNVINSSVIVENANDQSSYDKDMIPNVTLAEILKKDALIPLHNKTIANILDQNSEMINGDGLRINSEQYDTTTFSLESKRPSNPNQYKTEVTPITTSTLTSIFAKKFNIARTLQPPHVHTPSVVRKTGNSYEYGIKMQNRLNESTTTTSEPTLTTVVQEEQKEKEEKKEEVEEVDEKDDKDATATAASLIEDLIKDGHEFVTSNNKADEKNYLIATTTAATTIVNINTTLERNNDLQTTTAAATSTTIKPNLLSTIKRTDNNFTPSNNIFSTETIGEIDLVQEWRLINDLASDGDDNYTIEDSTIIDNTQMTTKEMQSPPARNVPINLQLNDDLKLKSLNEMNHINAYKDLSYSSSSTTTSAFATSSSSTTESNFWQLPTNNDNERNMSAYQNISNDQFEKFHNLPLTNNNDSSKRETTPVKDVTSQLSKLSEMMEKTEYPIEPLLLKFWSAYRAWPSSSSSSASLSSSIRKRND